MRASLAESDYPFRQLEEASLIEAITCSSTMIVRFADLHPLAWMDQTLKAKKMQVSRKGQADVATVPALERRPRRASRQEAFD
jgi:hypothetical protein